MKPLLWPYILQGNDEENYRDVPTGEDGWEDDGEESGGLRGEEGDEVEGEGVRGEEGDGRRGKKGRVCEADCNSYKISHRNPQFSGAENTCLWELKEVCVCVCVDISSHSPSLFNSHYYPYIHVLCIYMQLCNHYHPSVQLFSKKIASVS